MDLIQAYKDLLAVAGVTTTEDGFLNHQIGTMKKPFLVDGKPTVLPTPENLKGDKAKQVFHPFNENVLRGESPVLAKYRETLDVKNSMTILALAYELLTLATSQDDHAKLSPDQSEFLSLVKDADEKTLETFKKIMDAMPAARDINKCAVYTFLKRSGKLHGENYACVGVVSFPLYQEICKGESVYGVKLRKKDFHPLKAILEYLLPDIDKDNAYDRGSRSVVAPKLDALMQTQKAIAGALNDKIDLFASVLEDAEGLRYNDDWVEIFDDLESLLPKIRLVPPQAGNEGALPKGAAEPAPAVAPPVQQFSPQPVVQHQPVQPPQQPWTPYQPAPAAPGFGYPQQQQQQSFQPQQPQIRRDEGGINFNDVINSSPQLANIAYAQQQVVHNQQTSWRDAPPNWAAMNGGYATQQNTGFNSNQGGYGYNNGFNGGTPY